jgi:AcrR family transcriptional regulator
MTNASEGPPSALPSQPGRGRPRRPEIDARIIDAVIDELASGTYGLLRVDAVARRAGVAPTTVYRRYPTKLDLVKATLEHWAGDFETDPDLPLEKWVHSLLDHLVELYVKGPAGTAMVNLFADAVRTPDLADIHKEAMLTRVDARDYLARLQRLGKMRADVDIEVFIDLLTAVIPLRMLFTGEPVPLDLADRMTPILVDGVRPRAGSKESGR